MIILDTNVVSELMKPAADPAVVQWFDRQSGETLVLTTTGLAELLAGIERLPPGKRKENLHQTLVALRSRLLQSPPYAFDEAAANAYALLVSRARSKGHTISIADGQVAAIASIHNFAVATRDTAPFKAAGVAVINPWEA